MKVIYFQIKDKVTNVVCASPQIILQKKQTLYSVFHQTINGATYRLDMRLLPTYDCIFTGLDKLHVQNRYKIEIVIQTLNPAVFVSVKAHASAQLLRAAHKMPDAKRRSLELNKM